MELSKYNLSLCRSICQDKYVFSGQYLASLVLDSSFISIFPYADIDVYTINEKGISYDANFGIFSPADFKIRKYISSVQKTEFDSIPMDIIGVPKDIFSGFINHFDINEVQIAFYPKKVINKNNIIFPRNFIIQDYDGDKLVYTRNFEIYEKFKVLRVESPLTPSKTLIRILKKKHEIPTRHVELDIIAGLVKDSSLFYHDLHKTEMTVKSNWRYHAFAMLDKKITKDVLTDIQNLGLYFSVESMNINHLGWTLEPVNKVMSPLGRMVEHMVLEYYQKMKDMGIVGDYRSDGIIMYLFHNMYFNLRKYILRHQRRRKKFESLDGLCKYFAAIYPNLLDSSVSHHHIRRINKALGEHYREFAPFVAIPGITFEELNDILLRINPIKKQIGQAVFGFLNVKYYSRKNPARLIQQIKLDIDSKQKVYTTPAEIVKPDDERLKVKEIVTSIGLLYEGTSMNNCVAGYGPRIVKKNSRIFHAEFGKEKATVETDYKINYIRQARSVSNRSISQEFRDALNKWAIKQKQSQKERENYDNPDGEIHNSLRSGANI